MFNGKVKVISLIRPENIEDIAEERMEELPAVCRITMPGTGK